MDHLGEYDFLSGRTFIRDLDVLIDLSQNKVLVRDPERRRELRRKEVIVNGAQAQGSHIMQAEVAQGGRQVP